MNQNIVISRNVPQLVKSLLGANAESAVYEKCLEYTLHLLQKPRQPEPDFKVAHNMILFLERFKEEQLQQVGQTVKMLANAITNDQNSTKELQWALLDFMLSVNFCAFRQAQWNYQARLVAGDRILANLTLAYESQNNAEVVDSENHSDNSELNSSQSSSSETNCGLKNADSIQNVSLIAQLKLSLHAFKVSWLHQYLGPELSTYRFAVCYGQYLHSQLHSSMQRDTEYYLLRELLLMFFLPADYYYFKLIKNFVQLAPARNGRYPVERQLIERFVQPLQNMHLLQVYMDCYNTRIEFGTWNCLTNALRHLIKPLVETLTHFEHNLTNDDSNSTVSALWQASKFNFSQLQLLCQLSAENCCSHALPEGTPTHVRAQLLLAGLLHQTAQTRPGCLQPQVRKGYAAALLLHMLQVYCKCLDNWWQVGDFLDIHEEFAAKVVNLKTGIKYIMRQPHDNLRQCPLHKILTEHIKKAGHALALLHDSQRLHEFRTIHKRLLDQSLYTTLIRRLKQLLIAYKVKCDRKTGQEATAPDIYKQIYATQDEKMAYYYYVYHKETESDFSLNLLQRLQSCVAYTPFDKLICSALRQQLEQRATLIRCYLLHLLRKQLRLCQKFAHLRSVCLLLNFKMFAKQFEQFWHLLNRGDKKAAAAHLQGIIDTHNLGLTDKFDVHLPSCDFEQLALHYKCEPEISAIITQPQLQVYNAAFRHLLPLQLMLRKVQMLPDLPWHTGSMQQLRERLMQQLDAHLHLAPMQQAADRCDTNLLHANSLLQLQLAHREFVQIMADSILDKSDTCNNSQINAQDLFHISGIFIELWGRLLRLRQVERECEDSEQKFFQIEIETQETKQHFAQQYKLKLKRYLVNVDGFSQAVQFMLNS